MLWETVKFEAGGSCSMGSGRFSWEEFVINVDAEVSQMQWVCGVHRINASASLQSGAL